MIYSIFVTYHLAGWVTAGPPITFKYKAKSGEVNGDFAAAARERLISLQI